MSNGSNFEINFHEQGNASLNISPDNLERFLKFKAHCERKKATPKSVIGLMRWIPVKDSVMGKADSAEAFMVYASNFDQIADVEVVDKSTDPVELLFIKKTT